MGATMTDSELITLQSEVTALRIENADLREVIMHFWKPKVDALQAWKDAVPVSEVREVVEASPKVSMEVDYWLEWVQP